MLKKIKDKALDGGLTSFRVGFFLAIRQIRRTSKWTNILVICVMTLTFLNLIVVNGILVGLIEGAVEAIKTHYIGDVFITALRQKNHIEQAPNILAYAKNIPGVEDITTRYLFGGTVESEYKTQKKKPIDKGEEVATTFAGINPEAEQKVSDLANLLVEGEYLEPDDYDKVLVGGMLLRKYLDFDSPSFPVLKNVEIGSKLRITVGENSREVTVKGIVKSKVDEIDRRVFFIDTQLKGLIGKPDYGPSEISIRISPDSDPVAIKNLLVNEGFSEYATIQTQEEAEPKFIKDMKQTFSILGTAISSIGLIVAAITIFIVIFINAITRRKFIGILKGIGIKATAIEWAYVFQAIIYAIIGTTIGVITIFGFLKPYFDANPINFPFSDGILVATPIDAAVRIVVLLIATLIAGYIPVRLITKQNTLDAILNR